MHACMACGKARKATLSLPHYPNTNLSNEMKESNSLSQETDSTSSQLHKEGFLPLGPFETME